MPIAASEKRVAWAGGRIFPWQVLSQPATDPAGLVNQYVHRHGHKH